LAQWSVWRTTGLYRHQRSGRGIQ
jgi:hypothetical protein